MASQIPNGNEHGLQTHHVARRSFVRAKCNGCGHPLNSASGPCNFPSTTRVRPFDPPRVSAHDRLLAVITPTASCSITRVERLAFRPSHWSVVRILSIQADWPRASFGIRFRIGRLKAPFWIILRCGRATGTRHMNRAFQMILTPFLS